MKALNKNIEAERILELFEGYVDTYFGNRNAQANNIAAFSFMNKESLVWMNSAVIEDFVKNKREISASIIITDNEGVYSPKHEQCLIIAKKSRLLFVKILQLLVQDYNRSEIHETAIISQNVTLGENVSIGPYCIIGENVEIGNDVIIDGNVYIYSNVKIGSGVIIQAGAVIGTEVLSFTKDNNNLLTRFPTFGNVLIKDFVEIGSNVTIVKSALTSTIILENTKINSNSYIGSSVLIGQNNYIAAGVMINGSTNIGNDNFIGSGSIIRNKINIGDSNTIGAGAVVVKNIGSNKTITGNPAKENSKSYGVKL